MSTNLPQYYFRARENGAMVFRVDAENRMRRVEMDQIAVVNVKNGEVKPHGGRDLTEADNTAISNWLDERRDLLRDRELDDIRRLIDRLNLTAAWAQQKASPEDLQQVSDTLLMAMHDLRSVLVRKKSDQLRKDED